MKKVLLIILTLIATMTGVSRAQVVDIPDPNFKTYLVSQSTINTNADTEIQVSEAAAYSGIISCFNMNISEMTGIEAFTSITALYCHSNSITSLDVSNCVALATIGCSNNFLVSLDLSNNSGLTSLDCSGNLLTSLNVANGNNTNMSNISFNAQNNGGLTCIEVDDATYSSSTWALIDSQTTFSENCNGGLSLEETQSKEIIIYPNPATEMVFFEGYEGCIHVYDVSGNLMLISNNVNNCLNISSLQNGLYFVRLQNNSESLITHIIKN